MRTSRWTMVRRAVVPVAVAGLACTALSAKIAPGEAVVASLGQEGVPSNSDSYEGTVSNNGRYVAFYSEASNLGPTDGNDQFDIYVRDMKTGVAELISVDEAGNPGNNTSYYPALSANGRYILYYTYASNLAEGADDDCSHVVLHDRKTGTSTQVTVAPNGDPANESTELYNTRPLSGNGRWAVFASEADNLVEGDTNGDTDIFLADLRKGAITRISNGIEGEADGDSYFPSLSPNGRWVVYVSAATNLVEGDQNNADDVFLYDVKKRTTRRVSVNSEGSEANNGSGYGAPAVANNGRLVAFTSYATNLDDGEDTNASVDIFLRDVRAGTTRRVSLGFMGQEPDGNCGDVGISPDGRLITYYTYASNLVDATDSIPYDQIVHDIGTGENRRMLTSPAGDAPDGGTYGYFNGFSANGKWYAVASNADNVSTEAGEFWNVFLVRIK